MKRRKQKEKQLGLLVSASVWNCVLERNSTTSRCECRYNPSYTAQRTQRNALPSNQPSRLLHSGDPLSRGTCSRVQEAVSTRGFVPFSFHPPTPTLRERDFLFVPFSVAGPIETATVSFSVHCHVIAACDPSSAQVSKLLCVHKHSVSWTNSCCDVDDSAVFLVHPPCLPLLTANIYHCSRRIWDFAMGTCSSWLLAMSPAVNIHAALTQISLVDLLLKVCPQARQRTQVTVATLDMNNSVLATISLCRVGTGDLTSLLFLTCLTTCCFHSNFHLHPLHRL